MSESSEYSQDIAVDQPDLGPAGPKQLIARYGQMGHLGIFSHDLENLPVPGTRLVLRTPRGAELGKTLINLGDESALFTLRHDQLEQFLQASGPEYPLSQGGRVLRVATPQDINDQAHLDKSAHEEGKFCRDQIRHFRLDMRLVTVEHLLGGERIIFYFIAEQRVDFRDLVRVLATQYHTRIEMRQVGARDEARLVADYERCGRRCCCQDYLKLLKPVSMRMAKCQKATLDPTKISGRCGRLMCCLRHEDETYDRLQGQLPKKGIWVRLADGVVGRVLDAQILTQLVRLYLPNGTQEVVSNEEIQERNVPEPPMQTPVERRRPRPSGSVTNRIGPRVHLGDDVTPAEAPAPSADAAENAPDAANAPADAAETSAPNEADYASSPGEEGPDAGEEMATEQPGQQPSEGQSGQPGQERRPRRRHSRNRRRHPEALSAGPQVRQGPPPQGQANPSESDSPPQDAGPAGEGQGAGQGQRRRRRRRRRGHGGQSGPGQAGPDSGGDAPAPPPPTQ